MIFVQVEAAVWVFWAVGSFHERNWFWKTLRLWLFNLVYVFVSSYFFVSGTLLATGKLKPGTARGRRKQQLGMTRKIGPTSRAQFPAPNYGDPYATHDSLTWITCFCREQPKTHKDISRAIHKHEHQSICTWHPSTFEFLVLAKDTFGQIRNLLCLAEAAILKACTNRHVAVTMKLPSNVWWSFR